MRLQRGIVAKEPEHEPVLDISKPWMLQELFCSQALGGIKTDAGANEVRGRSDVLLWKDIIITKSIFDINSEKFRYSSQTP